MGRRVGYPRAAAEKRLKEAAQREHPSRQARLFKSQLPAGLPDETEPAARILFDVTKTDTDIMGQMGPKDALWLDDSTASFVIGHLMVNALMEKCCC